MFILSLVCNDCNSRVVCVVVACVSIARGTLTVCIDRRSHYASGFGYEICSDWFLSANDRGYDRHGSE